MEQPPGFKDPNFSSHVCHLKEALYGLKQAPRAWFDHLSTFLFQIGFFSRTADSSLFICHSQNETLILLVYVDDMILTGDKKEHMA